MREQTRTEIGARLRAARIEANLTQEEVASDFMRTRQAVSSWENGHTLPSLGEFRELATLYGISADALLYGGNAEEISTSLFDRLRPAASHQGFADSAM